MDNLIKIRDISNKYDISARTLRYYEDMGLLTSIRTNDYAYRLYDEDAIIKLEQILVLRKFNISIKDIQLIFNTPGSKVVLDVLGKKVIDIDNEVALLHELKGFILEFIRQIELIDFNADSDIKMLYSKAKEIEAQLTTENNATSSANPINAQRMMEVTKETNRQVSNVMVVKLPTFRAVTEGWEAHDESFWHWSWSKNHLFKDIVWSNCEFFINQDITCNESAAILAIQDHVTETDTAPYEIITVEGGLYASAVCVDMDDESVSNAKQRIFKWLEGTVFVHDEKRKFMTHKLFPHNDVKRGLGYHQLIGYMPITFDTGGWVSVYSLATDKVIQGIDQGATWQGFPSHEIGCTGSSDYTFCEVDGRNGILLTNRKNDWDGVNINLDKLSLESNHLCSIEVRGRITSDIAKFPNGSIELTCLPGYANMAYHPVDDGVEFTLMHTLPIVGDMDVPRARISSGHAAREMSFVIEHIEVSVKPITAELNYVEAIRPLQEVTDLEAFEVVYNGKDFALVNGATPPPQTVIKAPAGKYLRVTMPSDCTDYKVFIEEVYERYLPIWLGGGAGHVLTGKVELMIDNVLFLNIQTEETKGE